MDNMDFMQWPVWLVAFLLILNLFKTPLISLFPVAFSFLTSKAKSRVHIQEMEAEAHRQDEVTEKLMLARLVQESLNLNRELTDFIKTIIVARLDIMDTQLATISERLIGISSEQKNLWRQLEKVVNGN